jgi:hypothetical protein
MLGSRIVVCAMAGTIFWPIVVRAAECEFLGFPGGDAVITMQEDDSCIIDQHDLQC